MGWVESIFAEFYGWLDGDYAADRIGLVGAFGQALGGLMSGLTAAVQFRLGDWTAPDAELWGAFTTWVQAVFARFYAWLDGAYTTDRLALVGSFGQALGGLMGGLQTAAQFRLGDWAPPNTELWESFTTWVQAVFARFYAWLDGDYTTDRLALVGAFGQALGGLMQGLQAALNLAAEFAFQEPNGDTWAAFERWVLAIMARLTAWVQETYPAGGNFEPVASFGQAMNAVFGGLAAALEVFKGLQGYIPILNSRIEAFIASVTYAYGLVARYATGPGVSEGTAATTAFAGAVSAVFNALGAALSVFGQLTEGTAAPAAVFERQMATLIERISGTLTAWQTYVQGSLDVTWLPAAKSFADAVNSVLDVLRRALDLFTALDEHGLPSMAQLQDLIDYTLRLFATFASGLLASGNQVGGATGGIQTAIGNNLGWTSSLLGGTSPAAAQWGYGVGQTWAGGLLGYAQQRAAGDLATVANNEVQPLIARYFGPASGMSDDIYARGAALGSALIAGMAAALNPATATGLSGLDAALDALVDWIERQVRASLGISSPSRLMQELFATVPAGAAAGILAGLPAVADAAGQLALAVEPAVGGLFGGAGYSYEVSNERRIVVEFRGQAGGGVPLAAQQFEQLKRELVYAVRTGA